MRDRVWTDCLSCGAANSMRLKTNAVARREPVGYEPIEIPGLTGYFCEVCGDGIWTAPSQRTINRVLGEHMARADADRVVASELSTVPEAAKALQVSRSAINKMMNEGRIRYVAIPGLWLPLKSSVAEMKEAYVAARAEKRTPDVAARNAETGTKKSGKRRASA